MLSIHSYHKSTSNTDDLVFDLNQEIQTGTYRLIDFDFDDTDASPWCWDGIDKILISAPASSAYFISLGTLSADVAGEAAAIKAAFDAVTNVLFAVADQATVTVVWNNTLKQYTITPDAPVTWTIAWSQSSAAGVFGRLTTGLETFTDVTPLVLTNLQWLDEHPKYLEVRIREASGNNTSTGETRAQLVVEVGTTGLESRLKDKQTVYISGPRSQLSIQINREHYTAFSTTSMPYTNEWRMRFIKVD